MIIIYQERLFSSIQWLDTYDRAWIFFSYPFFLRVLACCKGVGLSLNSHLQQPKFSVCLRPLKPKPLDFGVLPFPQHQHTAIAAVQEFQVSVPALLLEQRAGPFFLMDSMTRLKQCSSSAFPI